MLISTRPFSPYEIILLLSYFISPSCFRNSSPMSNITPATPIILQTYMSELLVVDTPIMTLKRTYPLYSKSKLSFEGIFYWPEPRTTSAHIPCVYTMQVYRRSAGFMPDRKTRDIPSLSLFEGKSYRKGFSEHLPLYCLWRELIYQSVNTFAALSWRLGLELQMARGGGILCYES